MPSLRQTKILPFSAPLLFDLVMDIEKYPQFLPWCKQTKIVRQISENNLEADLLVSFKNFFEKYRSDVKYGKSSENIYFVDVVAIQGPFKKLINQWKFRDLEDGKCEIEFFIDFEFNSFLLSKMLGGIFERATEKMMQSFEDRARELAAKN